MDRVLIIDSDFIVNYLVDIDSNHQRVNEYLEKNPYAEFICLNLIKLEVATVLSRKLSQDEAILKMDLIGWNDFDYRQVDEALETQALRIYNSQTRKNTSLTDCAVLALAKEQNCKIASFEEFYKGYRFFD